MLDRNRDALIETARGLSEADARRRLVVSMTTPISLIKHAAAAERIWFQRFWAGLDESECDGYSRRDEGTFVVGDDESLAEVIAEFECASERSREIAAASSSTPPRTSPVRERSACGGHWFCSSRSSPGTQVMVTFSVSRSTIRHGGGWTPETTALPESCTLMQAAMPAPGAIRPLSCAAAKYPPRTGPSVGKSALEHAIRPPTIPW